MTVGPVRRRDAIRNGRHRPETCAGIERVRRVGPGVLRAPWAVGHGREPVEGLPVGAADRPHAPVDRAGEIGVGRVILALVGHVGDRRDDLVGVLEPHLVAGGSVDGVPADVTRHIGW